MAYNYGSSNGYYVMKDQFDVMQMQMQRVKELDALDKQRRQQEIADQLSRKDAEEYADDIIEEMLDQEMKALPCVESIDIQTEIQWYMRPYLLDFLIEAHAAFGLLPETLYLAVNILDRYCSKRVVYRKHYQLVGCTALLIAAKYGECSKKVPHIREIAQMCCNLYEEDMFIQMERHVMITLDWWVGAPTVDGFLQAALNEVYPVKDKEVECMALYISEIGLFHREFVAKRPSDLALSSLALAHIVLGKQNSVGNMWVTQYDPDTLIGLSQHLHRPSHILLQKYRSSQTCRVSDTLEKFLTRHAEIAKINMEQAAPPTPPAELPSPGGLTAAAYNTPQKPTYSSAMPNGCLTPPITPDIESFEGYNAHRRCPETPTPSSHLMPEHAHYNSGYYTQNVI